MYKVVNLVLLCISLIGVQVYAHQLTPTYPVFESSLVDGVSQTKMELFNKRKDVEYYEIGVFTSNWSPISFASQDKIVHVRYLETKKLNVYVKNEDLSKVTYICTESRLRKEDTKFAFVSSKICSKVR